VVNKTFQRVVSDKPVWFGHGVCGEGNITSQSATSIISQRRRPVDADQEGSAAAGLSYFTSTK